jgi:hypothetical protein
MSNDPSETRNQLTDSAAQPEQPSKSSDVEARKVFRNELTACLALVVPSGMTGAAKRDWLAVAWETLKHIPPDILKNGARKARETCDHPAKIVPAIIAATADSMRLHRERKVDERQALPPPDYPAVPYRMTQRILREVADEIRVNRESDE